MTKRHRRKVQNRTTDKLDERQHRLNWFRPMRKWKRADSIQAAILLAIIITAAIYVENCRINKRALMETRTTTRPFIEVVNARLEPLVVGRPVMRPTAIPARPYGKTDLGFASDAGYSQPARARSRAAYKGGRSS